MTRAFTRRLFWWAVFAVAFGYTEAVLAVYLRRATGMAPRLDYPEIFAARNLPFDVATIFAELRRQGVLGIEITREAATILLLVGAAWASGRTTRERLGVFGYTFALWDLSYYAFLALWIGFPRSLSSVDIFFLIPIASYGPVWFPVLVVMPALLVAALRLLRRAPD